MFKTSSSSITLETAAALFVIEGAMAFLYLCFLYSNCFDRLWFRAESWVYWTNSLVATLFFTQIKACKRFFTLIFLNVL